MTSSRFFPLGLMLLLLHVLTSYSYELPPFHKSNEERGEKSRSGSNYADEVSRHQRTRQVEVNYVTILTVAGFPVVQEHSGLEDGRLHLMQSLVKSKGKWDPTQPRYRLLSALKGYLLYKPHSIADLEKWRYSYKKLPRRQRKFIESKIRYSKKLNAVEHLIDRNAEIAHAIVKNGLAFYGVDMKELEDFIEVTKDERIADTKTNVLQAMKHFVRDWSNEGLHERIPTLPCMLNALQERFPLDLRSRNGTPVRVLIPGAGLGRLAHEVAALGGFQVTTNEWSNYMNLAYRYLLTLHSPHATAVYPYIDWWSHRATTASLTRSATFPDIDPSSTSPAILLIEGDFTTALASYTGTHDVVLTLFFIDTAKNILAYIETIYAMLVSGGVWINFGPLMYGTNPSLQLSLDEVVALAEGVGFEFEEPSPECGEVTVEGLRVRGAEVPYGSDEESLARNAYLAQHWVARKR